MDWIMDWDELYEMLVTATRSLGAEVTSPWFYTQLGIIIASAGIALGLAAALRRRMDIPSLSMGWPAPARLFVRVLTQSAATAIFAALMGFTRITMLAITWPSRSYLIATTASLCNSVAHHPPGNQPHPQ